jgi:hypothetical protein
MQHQAGGVVGRAVQLICMFMHSIVIAFSHAPAGASQLATWLLFVGSCVTTHFAAKGVALCRAPAGARQLATFGPQNVGYQPLVLCIVLLLVAVLLPGTLYTSRASHAKND